MSTRKSAIWLSSIAAVVLIGGIANACSPDTNPPSQPAGSIDTVTTTTTAAPTPTTTTTIAPPVTTIAAPPPVTEAPVVEAPVDTQPECGSDSYINSDGQCVHDPSSSPTGATAKCKDGTYSYSKHHSGTCSGHHGVAEWLN